jgi:hypothetical protein
MNREKRAKLHAMNIKYKCQTPKCRHQHRKTNACASMLSGCTDLYRGYKLSGQWDLCPRQVLPNTRLPFDGKPILALAFPVKSPARCYQTVACGACEGATTLREEDRRKLCSLRRQWLPKLAQLACWQHSPECRTAQTTAPYSQ